MFRNCQEWRGKRSSGCHRRRRQLRWRVAPGPKLQSLMTFDKKRGSRLAVELGSVLKRLSRDPRPRNVHLYRTTLRRLEALVGLLSAAKTRKSRKLFKELGRLRRRAGRVRDLDVQLALLRTVRASASGKDRQKVERRLRKSRLKQSHKLLDRLEPDALWVLCKGLRSLSASGVFNQLELPADPIADGRRALGELAQEFPQLNEATLHEYRIRCKFIRYRAELAGDVPAAAQLTADLKQLQDAIGAWHDCVQLGATAEKELPQSSSLLAAIHGVRIRKYEEALKTVQEVRRRALAEPARKPPRGATARAKASPGRGSRSAVA